MSPCQPRVPHLGEESISLADEVFTLTELPLPRKEPVHLSGLPGLVSAGAALPSPDHPALPSPSPQPPTMSLDISSLRGISAKPPGARGA